MLFNLMYGVCDINNSFFLYSLFDEERARSINVSITYLSLITNYFWCTISIISFLVLCLIFIVKIKFAYWITNSIIVQRMHFNVYIIQIMCDFDLYIFNKLIKGLCFVWIIVELILTIPFVLVSICFLRQAILPDLADKTDLQVNFHSLLL